MWKGVEFGMWGCVAALCEACVGKPAICATTWEVRTSVEQSYATGRPRPTGEVSVGGELGSDRCEEENHGDE